MERKMQQKPGTSMDQDQDQDDYVFVDQNPGMIMEHRIDMPPESPPRQQPPTSPPRRRTHPTFAPSLFSNASAASHHRPTSLRRPLQLNRKFLRGIPVLVLLCFFLIWWFSSPVNLVVKDGRLMNARMTDNMSVSLNGTHTSLERLAILAVATSPNSSVWLYHNI